MIDGTVIYCHGFASSGAGPKSLALVEAFGDDHVISPDLPIDPSEVEDLLDSIIAAEIKKTGGRVVIAGTSLGGFWSNYMGSKWLISCVIVNPALHPSTVLSNRVGAMTYNYATGDLITVTDENIAEYARREKAPMLKLSQELKTMFLAADDDVIDYTVALDELEVDSLFAKPDGGHRFEKYWPEVIEEIKNIFADL